MSLPHTPTTPVMLHLNSGFVGVLQHCFSEQN